MFVQMDQQHLLQMVVLALGGFFLISLVFGRQGGLLRRALRLRRRARSMEREHALRSIWESLEQSETDACSKDEITTRGGWANSSTCERLRRAETEIRFTSSGERQAIEVVRRHRLWEHYLIRRADFDEDHVDRGADELEHLLPLELLDELEKELNTDRNAIPASPHVITLPSSTKQRGGPS